MQPDLQQLLQQNLRDIQLPTEVGLWPLAPAWWWTLGALLMVVTVSAVILKRKLTDTAYRKTALRTLNQAYKDWENGASSICYLQTANQLLKRCLLHSPQCRPYAGLSGPQWATLLNTAIPSKLGETTSAALTELCYQAEPSVNIQSVHQDVTRWIRSHRFQLINDTFEEHTGV